MTVTVDRPNFPSGWDVGIPTVDRRNAQHPDAMVSLGRPPSSATRSARTLTFKEREILGLLATQLSRREIGQRLYVSLNTVKTHQRAVYRKLGTGNRSAAVSRARKLGLL
jgi:LuxR family maltose regulon positive regulatory protein